VTPDIVVRDNREASRFETLVEGHLAYLTYARRPHAFALVHTEVPDALRGRGVGSALAKFGLEAARAEGHPVRVLCPFVRAYLERHPEAGQPPAT